MSVPMAWGDIYVSEDDSGVPVFSDLPTDNKFRFYLRTNDGFPSFSAKKQGVGFKRFEEGMRRFGPDISAVATQYRIDPELLHAVIRVESAYDSNAVSKAGAVGLMQLTLNTAKRFGIENRYDPQENLKAGARYLSFLLQKFPDDLPLALAAYNAGEDAVSRHGQKIPPYRETMNYVPSVIQQYQTLKRTGLLPVR